MRLNSFSVVVEEGDKKGLIYSALSYVPGCVLESAILVYMAAQQGQCHLPHFYRGGNRQNVITCSISHSWSVTRLQHKLRFDNNKYRVPTINQASLARITTGRLLGNLEKNVQKSMLANNIFMR